MKPIHSILVVIDPEMRVTTAYRRAEAIARQCGARVHLCLFDYRPAIIASRGLDEAIMRIAVDEYMTTRQAWLEQRAVELSHDRVHSECAAIWGKPLHEMIIAKAIEVKADMVIKDVRPVPALARVIHAPLDWQLLRLCPIPLMLVNPQASPLPKRVIAAIDPLEDAGHPHELNDRILKTALDFGMQCAAPLHAVYAFEQLAMTVAGAEGGMAVGYARMLPQIESIHREAFDRLLDQYSIPDDRRHFLVSTQVEAAIGDFARDIGMDLLVMGTGYRGGFERLLMGSTAERILYHITCDVLTVKADGFAAELVSRYRSDLAHAIDYGKLAV